MSKAQVFLLRFAAVVIVVGGILAWAFNRYFDEVQRKSFYYKLERSEVLEHLAKSEVICDSSYIEIRLLAKDSTWICEDYQFKKPAKSVYKSLGPGGDLVADNVASDQIPAYIKRLFKKVNDTGLMGIYQEDSRVRFENASGDNYYYVPSGGLSSDPPANDLSGTDSPGSDPVVLDDNWYLTLAVD